MYYEGEEFLWVDSVFISEEHRGKGVGKKIYEELERIAKEKGVKKILCDVFNVNNDSMNFHKKIGFKERYTIFEKKL